MIWNTRIKEQRELHKLTLLDVAKKMGISESTAQRYESERGIKNIPYDAIVKYAEILNVSPAYLMGWENPSPAADQPDHTVVGAAKPALSDRAYMVGRAYEHSDYLTQRMVERTLGIEEEAELKEPAGRQAFTA